MEDIGDFEVDDSMLEQIQRMKEQKEIEEAEAAAADDKFYEEGIDPFAWDEDEEDEDEEPEKNNNIKMDNVMMNGKEMTDDDMSKFINVDGGGSKKEKK
jgi:hypothetical protein